MRPRYVNYITQLSYDRKRVAIAKSNNSHLQTAKLLVRSPYGLDFFCHRKYRSRLRITITYAAVPSIGLDRQRHCCCHQVKASGRGVPEQHRRPIRCRSICTIRCERRAMNLLCGGVNLRGYHPQRVGRFIGISVVTIIHQHRSIGAWSTKVWWILTILEIFF